MLRRLPLWTLARVSFVCAVAAVLVPGRVNAAVSLGDVQFTWAHVLVLVTAAAAWGDMRSQNKRHGEDITEIRKELEKLWDREHDRGD